MITKQISEREYKKLLMWIDDLLDSPSLACIDAEENKIEEIVSSIIEDTNNKCKVVDFGIGTDNKPNYILGALNKFKVENPGVIPIIINLDKKLDLFNKGLQDLAYTINMNRELLIFYTCTPVIMVCSHEMMDALIQYAHDFVTTIDFRWSVSTNIIDYTNTIMELNKDINYVKPETYRLISIQNKEVLDIIESQGVYRPLINLVRYENLKIRYEDMIRLMYKSIPIEKPYAPVWGFYRLHNESPPEDIHDNIYYGIGPSPSTEDKDLVMLVLDVPCTEVLLTSFYEWTDYIYFKEYPDDDYPYTCSVEDILKLSRNYEDSYEVQATFPKITKDMIVRVIYPDKKLY